MNPRRNENIRWEKQHLERLNLLATEEELLDAEQVSLGVRIGVLFLTDLRILFSNTGVVFRRRTDAKAIALAQVERVEGKDGVRPWPRLGTLVLSTRDHQGREAEYKFEHIAGGLPRAKELAEKISDLREALRDCNEGAPGSTLSADTPMSVEPSEPRLKVVLARGVASYVKRHGGRLYIWGRPMGSDLEWMKASTNRPEGRRFVPFHKLTEFELFVQEDLMGADWMRLERRWWLPGQGIIVDTGVMVDSGGGP